MKSHTVVSQKSDLIMIILFASVIIGLVGNGLYSYSSKSILSYFYDKNVVVEK